MTDTIETIGKSLVQHGKLSNRIYLMKLHRDDYQHILELLDALASRHGYSKIFAKVPGWASSGFIENGYCQEALIPKFYADGEAAIFLGRYLDKQRAVISDGDMQQIHMTRKVVNAKLGASSEIHDSPLPRILTENDAQELAELYGSMFKTYPFPIDDVEYIRETMATHCTYVGIYDRGRLIAASSAEMDIHNLNAEMTDFATLTAYQGNRLAALLLRTMEDQMSDRGFQTLFTIARACSVGMNLTFARMGYQLSGTLVNNTNIAGRIESMNVWYKHLV